jgi:hypothetical protein
MAWHGMQVVNSPQLGDGEIVRMKNPLNNAPFLADLGTAQQRHFVCFGTSSCMFINLLHLRTML